MTIGRVVSTGGVPLSGLLLRYDRKHSGGEQETLQRERGLGSGGCITDAGGRFRIAGVRAGEYGLSLSVELTDDSEALSLPGVLLPDRSRESVLQKVRLRVVLPAGQIGNDESNKMQQLSVHAFAEARAAELRALVQRGKLDDQAAGGASIFPAYLTAPRAVEVQAPQPVGRLPVAFDVVDVALDIPVRDRYGAPDDRARRAAALEAAVPDQIGLLRGEGEAETRQEREAEAVRDSRRVCVDSFFVHRSRVGLQDRPSRVETRRELKQEL